MPKRPKQPFISADPVETTEIPGRCPFCNAGPKIYPDDPEPPCVFQYELFYLVICNNIVCRAMGPARMDPDAAVRAWNYRYGGGSYV